MTKKKKVTKKTVGRPRKKVEKPDTIFKTREKKLSVLIADDHKLVRKGIQITLEENSEFTKIEKLHEAENGEEAVKRAELFKYDIIFMDLNMPVMNGVEATKKIIENNPEAKIIALSMHNELYQIRSVIKAGAKGYILKNTGVEEINRAISTILKGGNYYSNEVAMQLMGTLHDDIVTGKLLKTNATNSDLSKREKQVLTLIAREYTNNEIAEEIKLSRRTVDSHRYNILNKIGAKNTAGLIKFAISKGFI